MKVAMRECAEVLEGTPPDQVTIPLARKYREHLQKSRWHMQQKLAESPR